MMSSCSCCLHYCKDKAKDFMSETRGGPVRLHREVVLLTDDRNLRVKALTRHVPVRDIPAFLSWAKGPLHHWPQGVNRLILRTLMPKLNDDDGDVLWPFDEHFVPKRKVIFEADAVPLTDAHGGRARVGHLGTPRVPLQRLKYQPPFTFSGLEEAGGSAPRGKGRGILDLTDLSRTLPEPGPRLLFGGPRGATASRGGSVRRLWDPNNPDQKPPLSRPQLPQHSPLLQQQPMYLQTGGGYGQLHDEVAGSPPVYQGEGVQSQQATAIPYYNVQNWDNPYGSTM
ncbi:hypothetical protein CRUP_024660 [Coryphaenoides rupestris]|nr:hypothetical protein CRUP_024660 [Coryphaenoides rupestris]